MAEVDNNIYTNVVTQLVHYFLVCMNVKMIVIILLIFSGLCISEKVSYDGYSLIRVNIKEQSDIERLQRLADDYNRKIDIWSYPSKQNPYMDILVSPDVKESLKNALHSSDHHWNVLIENVQSTILETDIYRRRRRYIHRNRPAYFSLADYNTFDEIENWLLRMNVTHSNKLHVFSLGKTIEGRDIWLAQIIHPNNHNVRKPAIFLDAGIHAREWISQATALYIINELINLNHGDNADILKNFDWYIVPVANPDGYAFSMSTDRLWRKTRSVHNNGERLHTHSICKGVDINRNFDHHWGESGSNIINECSNIYAGPRAFSEIETQVLARKLRELSPVLKLYASFHAYGQLWLAPWGYHKKKPGNYAYQNEIAWKAMAALKRVNETEYTFGSIADLMCKDINEIKNILSNSCLTSDPASGTSVDYAHSLGIPLTFALELRPEDSDHTQGFLYPAKYIAPTGKETFEALKAIAKEIIQ